MQAGFQLRFALVRTSKILESELSFSVPRPWDLIPSL
ncbi:MAG: hypothetical protein ACI91B_002475 [Planctomycetota bacterium]|jgi:hypothetical protein